MLLSLVLVLLSLLLVVVLLSVVVEELLVVELEPPDKVRTTEPLTKSALLLAG